MIRRRTIGIAAALAIVGNMAFLISGHPSLSWPQNGLPLGTIAAGLLVAGFGALPLAIAPVVGAARRLAIAVFALAAVWLPATLLLAGNLRLNFLSGQRGEWATMLAAVTLAAVAFGLIVALIARGHRRWTMRRQR